MNKYFFLFLSLMVLAMCQTPNVEKSASTNKKNSAAEATFKKLCASCHGADAFVFADREWKHGKTKADIVTSISNGYPDLGMPLWSATFKPEEISAMADYIIEGIEKRKTYDFSETPKSNIFVHNSMSVKMDTIANGIKKPWGMSFLPDGDMVFTDCGGDIYRIGKDKIKTKITGGPKVLAQGQGGLLDVELHPKYAENKQIYFSYSKYKDSIGGVWSTTAVMRATLDGNTLTEAKDIFVAHPYLKTRHHYGSRLEFDRNGFLFIAVGDRGQHDPLYPQRLDMDCGKIHRVFDDGRAPLDNPFSKIDTARKTIWSIGHRNPQGMAMNPTTGEMWENEHGPRGGDEVNIPQKSKNYGWPVISYGINYNGTILTPYTKMDNMEQPLIYWVPSIGPSGMTFVTGDKYKAWKGDALVGSLRFKYLNRCKVEGNKIVSQENLLKNIGRLRFVEMGRDGYIYVGVEEPGYIFKLVPVENQ
jgi:aldose sugar dehydrogenase